MSNSQRLLSRSQTGRPLLVSLPLSIADPEADASTQPTGRTGGLWSDRIAFRIWLLCGLILWLVGFINLVTGVARR
jgi:hypothetical protein